MVQFHWIAGYALRSSGILLAKAQWLWPPARRGSPEGDRTKRCLSFTWGIILALILVNAVYVAAEFAAVGVPKSRVLQRAEEGNSFARLLAPILSDSQQLDRYIAASQVGITLSSLVLGAFGELALAGDLAALLERAFSFDPGGARSAASATILVGLTLVQMVLGELVPKSIALQHPTEAALWTVGRCAGRFPCSVRRSAS